MDNFTYTGVTQLEVMAQATNYFKFLSGILKKYIEPEDHVIDFGAGIGTFAATVGAITPHLTCVDIDNDLLAALTARGLKAVKNLNSISPESQDLIYGFDVLEHIEQDQDIINQWYQLLKPGGRVIIYTPAFSILYGVMDKRIGHYRRYRARNLRNLLTVAGFEKIHTEYVDSLGFFGSLVYKWVYGRNGDLKWGPVKFYDQNVFPVSRKIDHLTHNILGKNVLAIGRKPFSQGAESTTPTRPQ